MGGEFLAIGKGHVRAKNPRLYMRAKNPRLYTTTLAVMNTAASESAGDSPAKEDTEALRNRLMVSLVNTVLFFVFRFDDFEYCEKRNRSIENFFRTS